MNFQPANRISSFKPYFFAQLSQTLNELANQGKDIIRIDIGSPDLPPKDFIIDELAKQARLPNKHGYTPNGGTPEFHEAVAAFYGKRFGIELDAKTETLTLIGSKEGLFNLSQVFVNPGDVVLVPDPGYPVYQASGIIAGAEIYLMPLLSENGYLPILENIPLEILKRTKILWLNYPNNPTGAIATSEFFSKVINFAKRHHILVAHDAPYSDVCFDGYKAPSILQIPGAKDVAVEFNSLSKTYNMAGWRLGMAVGNPEVIKMLHTYKSQMDSSHFAPILDAGIAALTGDQSWLKERNNIYQTRRDLVVSGLRSAGFQCEIPPAAIYVWARLPRNENDSMAFCQKLLVETGVSTTPGVVYGKYGEGFLRISLGTPTSKISEAMERIIAWEKSR